MEEFAQDLVSLLQFLIPGFIAAWVFYGLTPFVKPSQFERIVQALIYTLIVKVFAGLVIELTLWIGKYWSIGYWNESKETGLSLLLGLSLGLLASYLVSSDKLHKLLRDRKISKETSFPSEWYGTFHKNITFVVLHLKDDRRLYGWPIEWPSSPSKGHFLIADPSWQLDDGSEARITGVDSILMPVDDVRWIEFMAKTWEKQNGKESVKSAST